MKQVHTKARPLSQPTINLEVCGHTAACKGIGTLAYLLTTAKLLANHLPINVCVLSTAIIYHSDRACLELNKINFSNQIFNQKIMLGQYRQHQIRYGEGLVRKCVGVGLRNKIKRQDVTIFRCNCMETSYCVVQEGIWESG